MSIKVPRNPSCNPHTEPNPIKKGLLVTVTCNRTVDVSPNRSEEASLQSSQASAKPDGYPALFEVAQHVKKDGWDLLNPSSVGFSGAVTIQEQHAVRGGNSHRSMDMNGDILGAEFDTVGRICEVVTQTHS